MTLIDCVLPRRFPPGTYTVVNPVSGFHLVFQCDAGVRGPFTIDFGGATFIFTVQQPPTSLPYLPCLRAHQPLVCRMSTDCMLV